MRPDPNRKDVEWAVRLDVLCILELFLNVKLVRYRASDVQLLLLVACPADRERVWPPEEFSVLHERGDVADGAVAKRHSTFEFVQLPSLDHRYRTVLNVSLERECERERERARESERERK